jgi:CheY-like chemotaxis protein
MNAAQAGAGKLVVVIDNHPLVLEATGGLFRSWGCRVVTAESWMIAVHRLAEWGGLRPDLIVSDYQLSEGATGTDAIEGLRSVFGFEIPALIISSDADLASRQAMTGAYQLLYKPVTAETIRGVLLKSCIL